MRLEGRRLAQAESLPLGSVRVSEEFLPGEKASAKGIKALRKRVESELGELGWWEGGGRLVGIGGTIRNLAAAAMRDAELPLMDAQGFMLERAELEELIELLADRPASKRGDLRGIKPDRGDVILGGALVLAAALDSGGFDGIEVTEAGLREGVFFERLIGEPRAVRRRAPRVGREPRAPLQQRAGARAAAWPRCRATCSTGWPPPASTTSATPSASCSGPPACSTTSARRSTTRITTATRTT